MELKRRLQQLEARIALAEQNAHATKPGRSRRAWAVMAVALAGALALLCYHVTTDNRLFEHYYQPYPNVVAFTERGSVVSQPENEALRLYEQGHYREALHAFEKSYQNQQATSSTLFYAGIACIETNRLEQAEQYLLMVAQQPDSAFASQARWYLALVYVKKDERRKAAVHLATLVRQTEAYRYKARHLLNEL